MGATSSLGCGPDTPRLPLEPSPSKASRPARSDDGQADGTDLSLPGPSPLPPSEAPPTKAARRLTLLHFNDIYCIEPAQREPVGGAARLAHTVKSLREEGLNPLTVFSGDAFNPSLLSTITLGAQMPPVLNEIGVNIACIGNHDFDFGTTQLMKLVKQCTFPWLMANVLDRESKKPYANAKATQLMEWHGVKVGFVGLVEEEWLETLGAVNPNDLEYVDFVEMGHKLAKDLKDKGAELLVAITHMRVPNDQKLCAECPEFDIVMGGHDHHYQTEFVGEVLMVKSGTDFRDLTRVDVVLPADGGPSQKSWTRLTMTSSVPEDPTVAKIVDGYMGKMSERMTEVIGTSLVDLDGRFTTVRTQESNLANLVCDVLRNASGADVVIVNGGTFRSDAIHPAGPFTLGDMMSILPMMDGTLVLEATGAQLIEGLENGVCMYPKLEGRFPQVSGIGFMFDPAMPPKRRIVAGSVTVNGEPIQMNKPYKLLTKPYVAEGKDGYDVFKQCRVLVSEEGGVLLPTTLRNHFRYLEVLNLWDPKPRIAKYARKWSRGVMSKRKQSGLGQPDQDADTAAPVAGSSGAAADTATSERGSAGRSSDNLLGEAEEVLKGDSDGDGEGRPSPPLEPLPSRTYVNTSDLCVLGDKYAVKPVCDGRITIFEGSDI